MSQPVPPPLLERIAAVTNRRARFVLDTILAKGSCSTIDLKQAGYDHPPRAARDAVDLGFALKRIKATREDGQRIAAYVFDERELDPKKTGRVILGKRQREALIAQKGGACNLCGAKANLQVDHRIPYDLAGESQRDEADPYQILDGICNRRKSWACEHCQNWLELRRLETCLECYWANPGSYTHIAMQPERRIDLIWTGEETTDFDAIKVQATECGQTLVQYIKSALKQRS